MPVLAGGGRAASHHPCPELPKHPGQGGPQICNGDEHIKPGTQGISDGKIQSVAEGPAKCSCACCRVVFRESATTAPTSRIYTVIELSGPSASLGWVGKGCWEDSVFQNLGSVDPGQNMTNSAAVSHDGCCLPRNTTETVRSPRNIKRK